MLDYEYIDVEHLIRTFYVWQSLVNENVADSGMFSACTDAYIMDIIRNIQIKLEARSSMISKTIRRMKSKKSTDHLAMSNDAHPFIAPGNDS